MPTLASLFVAEIKADLTGTRRALERAPESQCR
jgi:hypothetical protein